MSLASPYAVRRAAPDVDTYLALRIAAGLSPKDRDAATRALSNSVFAVQVLHDDDGVVGMGRVIGDGGCFYQVVDIAVRPAHQARGLGKVIMGEIAAHLAVLPPGAYVSLIADGAAHALYAQYGFAPTAPRSIGMALVRPLRD